MEKALETAPFVYRADGSKGKVGNRQGNAIDVDAEKWPRAHGIGIIQSVTGTDIVFAATLSGT